MKKVFFSWAEGYFYEPSWSQKLFSYLLYPLSLLYKLIVTYKYKIAKERDFSLKVVSVGNFVIGGSGKTPLVTALAKHFSKERKIAIILRGYGRKSRGLVVVNDSKKILCDVSTSGDEAMIYAQKLQNVVVIVSEDRVEGIEKAEELECDVVFLDDGYAKHSIKKLDLIIDVKTANNFFLPSGPYKEGYYKEKNIVLLCEDKDFSRVVTFKNRQEKMSLLTAIARPQRLEKYLCEGVVSRHYFEDHHDFTLDEVNDIFHSTQVDSLLVTYKDYVKLEKFDIPLSLMDLEVKIDEKILDIVKEYIEKKD